MSETGPVTIPEVYRTVHQTSAAHDCVAQYVKALGWLCVEVARQPKLLPVFLRLLTLVPRTVEQLQRARRLAARG